MRVVPVRTVLGEFYARDAIFLERFSHSFEGVELVGKINGSLCEPSSYRKEVWFDYRVRFDGVLAYECRELEICTWQTESSFDEVEGSQWTLQLGVPQLRHYLVSTYDMIYQLAATGFEFQVLGEQPKVPERTHRRR